MIRQGQQEYLTQSDHDDPTRSALPRHWVSEPVVQDQLPDSPPALLAMCDVTSATNWRTAVTSFVPYSAVGNNLPLLITQIDVRNQSRLLAATASFAFDYVARQKVGGVHMNFFIANQLPVPNPMQIAVIGRLVDSLVLELTFVSWDMRRYARAMGFAGPPFRWEVDRRSLARAELDALMFRLYGIVRDDVDYIMETFPIVKRKDEAEFGEYRTKRLILERYDAMAAAEAAGVEYQTALDPPPADPALCHPESSRPDWARVD